MIIKYIDKCFVKRNFIIPIFIFTQTAANVCKMHNLPTQCDDVKMSI